MDSTSPPDTFDFAAPVLRRADGMRSHYIPLPLAVNHALADVRRVECVINGHSVNRGIISFGDGERGLIVGQDLLRSLGARLGDLVTVSLWPDPAPDRVDLPEEFEAVLAQDEEAAERFRSMSPGKQRSLASYVTGAKRTETRLRRAFELAEKLRTHTLYGDQRPG